MHQSFMPTLELLHSRGDAQKAFHDHAAGATRECFGKRVFIRAVVEISNFCRENCAYCGMRRDNRSLARFRSRYEQLAELLIHHCPPSVTDVNIQSGEDPVALREVVVPLVQTLRQETVLGISVSLGSLAPAHYRELKAAGASIYIMKYEAANPLLFAQLEAPGTLENRLQNIRHLAENGWRVSSGFIAGLPGQTGKGLLENFKLAFELPISGCSVSPFIPGDETPLAREPMADVNLTLNCMAALRLMRPNWIIPAVSALNLAEPDTGYRRGLRTGANLVTINLTPAEVRGNYLIYKRDRFIMTEERILGAIETEGLQPSTQGLAEFYRAKAVDGKPALEAQEVA